MSEFFLAWVSSVINGNSDTPLEAVSKNSERVAYEARSRFSISRETNRAPSSQHGAGGSIKKQLAQAMERSTPQASLRSDILAKPAAYISAGGASDIPGWSFSEVETETCSGCAGGGRKDCGGCGGKGVQSCTSCGFDGTVICTSCGGRGSRPDAYAGLTDARGMPRSGASHTCFACTNGRARCGRCGGSKRVSCSSCAGTGSKDCMFCGGAGRISHRNTTRYVAATKRMIRLESADAEARSFVDDRWARIADRGFLTISSTKAEPKGSDTVEARWTGSVTVTRHCLKIEGHDVTALTVGEGEKSVSRTPAFLDSVLGLSNGDSPAFSTLAGRRAAGEAIEALEAAKGDDRAEQAAGTMETNYAGALSSTAARKLVEIAGRAVADFRKTMRPRAAIRFAIEGAIIGLVMMAALSFLFSIRLGLPHYAPINGPVFVLVGAIAAGLLSILISPVRMRGRLRKAGAALRIPASSAGRLGAWWLALPVAKGLTALAAAPFALIAIFALALYTPVYGDEFRDGVWFGLVEGFGIVPPPVTTAEVIERTGLFDMAELDPVSVVNLEPGDRLRVHGATLGAMKPVSQPEAPTEIYWVDTSAITLD